MGQKVNPHGMRVGVIKDWDSRWYASSEKVGDLLVEDKKIRDFLKKKLFNAQVPKIEIERSNGGVTIFLHCVPAWSSARRARTSRPPAWKSRSSSASPPS